jgi:hypothetical protein
MDALTSLKTAVQNGSGAYDETQSVNAMLSRKMQRQTPFQVLEYLDKIVCATVEGANQNLKAATSAGGISASAPPLQKVILDALTTVFKTWQNAALPTFISGACIDSEGDAVINNSGGVVGAAVASIDEVRQLPETFNRVLGVMAQLSNPASGTIPAPVIQLELAAQLSAHYARYLFAQKFVAESATKSLSDQNVRRARFFAQVAGVESYTAISAALATKSSANITITSLCSVIPETFVETEFADALSMAFSANTWLGDLLAPASEALPDSKKVIPSDFDPNRLFMDNVKRSLNLVARSMLTLSSSSSSNNKVFVEPTLFSSLPPSLQTRCLVQLAWRGLSRTAPAAVLFRRLNSLGLSSSRPGILFLTCVGLLTDAPSSQKRDKALEELVSVYFTRKPTPPLGAEIDLKKEFDAYVKECLAWKGSFSTSVNPSSKAKGVETD